MELDHHEGQSLGPEDFAAGGLHHLQIPSCSHTVEIAGVHQHLRGMKDSKGASSYQM